MRKVHNIAVGLYAIYKFLLKDFIPENGQEISLTLIAIIGIVLIVCNLFFLFFDREAKTIKSFDSLTSTQNLGNYIQIWFLLLITNLDHLHPLGTIFYLSVTLSLLVLCFWTVMKDALKNQTLITGVIIGHAFLGYCMYNWSKGTYSRQYGDEIIGSFWEKPNYKAKYLVKLHQQDGDQVYTLPAQLHVFSETYEDDYGDGYQSWTERYIMVESVYFNNGGYLTFDACNLNEGGKVYCIDQNSNGWYIELTGEKVE